MATDPDEPSEEPTGDAAPPDVARTRARDRIAHQSDAGGDSDTTSAYDAGSTPPSGTLGDRPPDPNQSTVQGTSQGTDRDLRGDIGAGGD